MAVYAVGDIQGCYQALRALLNQVNFNAEHDVLWCCGDMVNRGPDSLAVLRFLRGLGDACVCVLGNHDLQLLAYAAGGRSFPQDTLDEVVVADDQDDLIHWLRFRPLLVHDAALNWCMFHAGLSPLWTLDEAKKRANQVENILQSDDWKSFCKKLQHKDFPTQDTAKKHKRDVFTTAILTRTRYCQQDGLFDWGNKSSTVVNEAILPWFEHQHLAWRNDCRVVYGHWAAKGLVTNQAHVLGLDSGCVWGGKLTLARLDTPVPELSSVACASCLRADV